MKKCFIVCPIGQDGSETRKRSDTLLNYVLKPLCESCGFEAIRVDELNTGGSITQTILDYLINSELVIADLTEQNANAFYELGFRSALGKPTIQIKAKGESIPFDVVTIQTFDYNITDIPDTEIFKSRLKKTIESYTYDNINDDKPSETTSSNFNSVILQEIYKLQDMIKELTEKSSFQDTAAISVLADKLTAMNAKTPDTILMETLLPKFLENPEQMLKLAEFANKFPPKK